MELQTENKPLTVAVTIWVTQVSTHRKSLFSDGRTDWNPAADGACFVQIVLSAAWTRQHTGMRVSVLLADPVKNPRSAS